jgi:uncharacterized membrane protein YcaP (DUF421 family)
MDILPVFWSGWPSLLRIVLVGVPAYLILVALLLWTGKHTLAKSNAYGLVVTVALGSALASAIATRDVSLADGVAVLLLLLLLEWLVGRLVSRSSRAARLLTQRPVMLLHHGRLQREAMLCERVTEGEVLAAIRKHGLDCTQDIGAVVLEVDGSFSVIPRLGAAPTALADVDTVPAREPSAASGATRG